MYPREHVVRIPNQTLLVTLTIITSPNNVVGVNVYGATGGSALRESLMEPLHQQLTANPRYLLSIQVPSCVNDDDDLTLAE